MDWGVDWKMDAAKLVPRVANLPESWRLILAEMSRGLSNAEIARKYGYKSNSIGTLIGEINKTLGIGKNEVFSRIEKRRLATDAFKMWEATENTAGRLESVLMKLGQQGYDLETVIDVPERIGAPDRIVRIIVVRGAGAKRGRHSSQPRL